MYSEWKKKQNSTSKVYKKWSMKFKLSFYLLSFNWLESRKSGAAADGSFVENCHSDAHQDVIASVNKNFCNFNVKSWLLSCLILLQSCSNAVNSIITIIAFFANDKLKSLIILWKIGSEFGYRELLKFIYSRFQTSCDLYFLLIDQLTTNSDS